MPAQPAQNNPLAKQCTERYSDGMTDDERIFQAANAVLQQGMKPSWSNVRQQLGGGSKSTLVPALNRYWKTGGWRTLVAQPPTPPIPLSSPPEDVEMVPKAEMERAMALERERADGDRAHLMAMTNQIREEIQAPLRKAQDELFLARARIAALERERR